MGNGKLNVEGNPSAFKHVNVFHAMKCRKSWRNLANLEEKLWQEWPTKKQMRWTNCGHVPLPEIDTSKPGFLTRKGFTMVSLDPVTVIYLQAKSAISHHNFSEIINELIKKEITAAT